MNNDVNFRKLRIHIFNFKLILEKYVIFSSWKCSKIGPSAIKYLDFNITIKVDNYKHLPNIQQIHCTDSFNDLLDVKIKKAYAFKILEALYIYESRFMQNCSIDMTHDTYSLCYQSLINICFFISQVAGIN